ncbi:MAG: DUF58 domain-containing protein [Acidimicrobiales bacterium]
MTVAPGRSAVATRRWRDRPNRYRLALTPAGAGVLTLCFPGLLVSAASGQRPLMALSLGAALVLAVNAAWALVALRSFTVAVEGPTAVTVGSAVPLAVVVAGPHRLEGALGVRSGVRYWVPAQMPGEGVVLWRARNRGVVERITVRLQTSIPLGLAAVVREVAVAPPAPVHAAPAAEPVVLTAVPFTGAGGGTDATSAESVVVGGGVLTDRLLIAAGVGPGDPIGLRPYVPGDPGRDVHWPTVARTGALMVRERPPGLGIPPEVTVLVRAADEAGADRVAGQARGAVEQLLLAGYRVVIDSVEAGDRVVGAVYGRDDLIARLARFRPGGPDLPGGDPVGGVGRGRTALMVDEDGLRWRSPT